MALFDADGNRIPVDRFPAIPVADPELVVTADVYETRQYDVERDRDPVGSIRTLKYRPGTIIRTSDIPKLYNPPTITSITPTTGPETGGTTVTIEGTDLDGTTGVLFDETSATDVVVVRRNTVTCTAPAHENEAVDVVLLADGYTATETGGFTYSDVHPIVEDISPASGPETGDTTVTITGSQFTGATEVLFGTDAGSRLTVVSDTELTVVTPAVTDGIVDVVITIPTGTTTVENGFTFTNVAPNVDDISPDVGLEAGGLSVTITGSQFTGATEVLFGTDAGDNLSVVSDTEITVDTPAVSAGAVDVTVTIPTGTTTVEDGFTYYPAVTTTGPQLAPAGGTELGGTTVTITGTHLDLVTSVTFDGVEATDLTITAPNTEMTVIAPEAPNSPAAVDVVLTAPAQTLTLTGAFIYTSDAPTVTGLDPDAGPAAGGTTVTIAGTNLDDVTGVTFGGIAATDVTEVSSESITVTTPAHEAGAVDVIVTKTGGTDTAAGGYTYS